MATSVYIYASVGKDGKLKDFTLACDEKSYNIEILPFILIHLSKHIAVQKLMEPYVSMGIMDRAIGCTGYVGKKGFGIEPISILKEYLDIRTHYQEK